ncbi:MAG: hypothetical protein J6T01_00705 [Kiritimatiellae bacterium]|nr:hypothetical protein [Kiritimatiellia bacterium]
MLYSDQDVLKPAFGDYLDLCDETNCWFWHSENIATMADSVRRCRDFIGPGKDLLLGLYMWDFTLRAPVDGKLMERQPEYAAGFLEQGAVNGLIFHPGYSAALEVDSVRLAKAWIKARGEDRWGSRA